MVYLTVFLVSLAGFEGGGGLNFGVLMAVYAGDESSLLADSLQSLLGQTLRASEVVVVEDGPISLGLSSVIDCYRSALNIKSVRLATNGGLSRALNEGLRACSSEFVARMDADDVCLPDRFEKQIVFMQQNPDVDVLGAWVEEYDATMTKSLGIRYTPLESSDIARFAKKRSPISHPSVVFRKCSVLAVGGYPDFRKAQDYALWSLMLSRGYKLRNLGEVLLKMRAGDGLMARRGKDYLRHELNILKFQREIGFINSFEFLFNALARSFVRLSPAGLKRLLYRVAR